jgi:tetratricopeptide (TPR) repeat protein
MPGGRTDEGGAAPAADPGAGGRRLGRGLGLVALAAATLAAFGGVRGNGWILFDDPGYVFDNPHISHGFTLAGLRWLTHAQHGANFHPLTSVTHMLIVQAFGLDPGAHHVVSLLLHALNAVLLALALHRLTGAWWRSVLVAALFALHPLRVESVAWASELKDVLSGLFFMLVLLAYARWAERPGAWRYGVVVACFGLGLLAKPMLVTLPFVLVLLDLWPLGRWPGFPAPAGTRFVPVRAPMRPLAGLLWEKWPLFALVAASSVVTFLVQRASGAVAPAAGMPLSDRAANAALAYWRYLGLTLWPRDLIPFHGLSGSVDLVRGLLGAVALAAVTGWVVWRARRRPAALVGWFWYVGTLVPVIGLVQVGMQSHADRYTYLSVIGIAVAVVWSLGAPGRGPLRVALGVAAVTALGVLGAATARQVAWWKDNTTLFRHVLAVDPGNLVAHQCLGSELLKSGQPRAAIPYFESALRTMPAFSGARLDLGSALGMEGRYDEAITQFRELLRGRDDAGVRRNLGRALARAGRPDEAIAEYEAALRLDPDDAGAMSELGALFGGRGRVHEAESLLRRAVELEPGARETRRRLAVTLALEDRVEEAIGNYRALAAQDSADLDALNNIAWIRATHPDPRHRDGAEAVRLAELACARSHEPAAVLFSTLAAAYGEAGRLPDAVRAGSRAVELARAERDSAGAVRYAQQLARYREGRAFHFGGQ